MGEVTLKIRWDGESAGLTAHRLSLAGFGGALASLPSVLRRIGSALLTGNQDDPDYGSRGGRFCRDAESLDVELVAIHKGCAEPEFRIVHSQEDAQGQLFETDLPRQVAMEFLQQIERTKIGDLPAGIVGDFLQKVPANLVTTQDYSVFDGGVLLKKVSVAGPAPDVHPRVLSVPRVLIVTGQIVGAQFEPRPISVELLLDRDRKTLSCSATQTQLDQALALRSQAVKAAVKSWKGKHQLLWLRSATDIETRLSPEEMTRYVASRWDKVMERLA